MNEPCKNLILIVEDDCERFRRGIDALIEGGFETAAVGAEEALEAARRRDPVAVLLGEQFSGLGEQIKNDPQASGVPVVQIINRGAETSDSRADLFLETPFSTAELAAQIEILRRLRSAEAQARESSELARLISENTPSILYIHDAAEGRNVFFSRQAADSLGYTREEIESYEGSFIEFFMHPEDRARLKAHFAGLRTMKDGEARGFLYRMRHKNGEWRWFESRDRVLTRDEDGAAWRILGAASDVTERQTFEESLRNSEERYRAFVAQSGEGIWRFEVTEPIPLDLSVEQMVNLAYERGYLAECNDAMAQMYGFERAEDLQGARLSDLFVREDPANEEYLRNFFENGFRLTESETHEKDADGGDKYFLNNLIGFVENGRLVRAWGTQRDITAQKRAEQELRASREQYRALFDSIDEGFCVIEMIFDQSGAPIDYRFLELNPSFEKQTGINPVVALGGGTILEIIPNIEKHWIETYGRIALTGEPERFVNGSEALGRWFDVYAFRIGEADSRRVAILFTDISERRRDEAALRESEATLRAFYSSSPLLMGITEMFAGEDEDVLHVYDNPATCRFFGVEPGATFNRRATELGAPPEVIRRWATSYRESERHARPVNFEYEYGRGENRRRLSVTVSHLGAGGEGRARFAYVAEDVTERQRAQERLIAAERRAAAEYQHLLSRIVPLAQTLGTARDLISVYRAIGEFVRSSMPCSAFFVSFYDAEKKLRTAAYAWNDGEEVGIDTLPPMPIRENAGPNSEAILNRRTVVTSGYMDKVKDRPHIIVGDDGRNPNSSLVVPMIVMNRVIGTLDVQALEDGVFDPEHTVALEMVANLAAVAIENVRLLETEANLRREAEAATRAKDEFIAVVSHELRSPLNAILGWARILQNKKHAGVDANAAIEIIVRNARAQSKLIEDLLDTARISSGKLQLESQKLNVAEPVANAVEMAKPSADAKNVRLEFCAETPIGEVEADADRLRQIFGNLLSNAVKFTPPGGAIKVWVERDEENAKITVADSGQGISREFLPFVFERFRQADPSSTRRHGGLGIGLALTKQLVEMHGGTIRADSAGLGKGATFTVRLPLAASPAALKNYTIEQTGNKNVGKLQNLWILVVDDEADARDMVSFMLQMHGAKVTTANSSVEALEILKGLNELQSCPNVLISDIGMPNENGYALIEKIRALPPQNGGKIPAIALTAFNRPEDKQDALEAGFQIHLGKPIEPENLVTAIAEVTSFEV